MARGADGGWRSFERRTPGSRTRRPDREPSGAASARESSTWPGRRPAPRRSRIRGWEGIDSEGRIPDSEWARALASEGSAAARIRNLEGSLPSFHRLSGAVEESNPENGFRIPKNGFRIPKRRTGSEFRRTDSEFRRTDSEERIPKNAWARALASEGSSGSRIRELAGSLSFSHRPSTDPERRLPVLPAFQRYLKRATDQGQG